MSNKKGTKTKRRRKSYEILEERGKATRQETSIETLTRQENEQLVREAERINLKTIVAERKARLKAAEKGVIAGAGSNRERIELSKALITNPKVQEQWLAMNPEARAILEASANTLSQQGQSTNALAGMMPFMMLLMKQNPQTSVKEMVELIKVVGPAQTGGKNETADLIRALTPLIQQQQGSKGGLMETITAVSAIFGQLESKNQALYLSQMKRMEDRIVDPIEFLKSFGANAEQMGWTRGGSNFDVEKLRIDTQLKMQKMILDQERWRDKAGLEKVAEEGRLALMSNIFTKGIETAAPLLEKFAGGKGGGSAQQQPTQPNTPTVYPCSECKTPINIIGNPQSITCPKCGKLHDKQIEEVGKPT